MSQILSRGRTSKSSGPDMYRQMVDAMPTAVMLCTLPDFEVSYVNKASVEALRSIEEALPVPADEIVGSCIDIFHKDPSHQRRILSDPGNLPHQARIQLGKEWLDLLVTPMFDASETYIGAMLNWSVITQKVEQEREATKLMQMLDKMPVNVMLSDKETFEIGYINDTSIQTLKPLRDLLPVPPEDLKGQCIDIFHKNPKHQRAILSDPSQLPHKGRISLGDEKLDLEVHALHDNDGGYIGPMLTWSIVTDKVKMADVVSEMVTDLATSAEQLQTNGARLNDEASNAEHRANAGASAVEELNASINEIASRSTEASELTQKAKDDAQQSCEIINNLASTSEKIGDVVALIQEISSQTNLLALNATIEAARAGEAGKGFAVVAAEVKELAGQTAKATEEIERQITQIQSAVSSAVSTNELIAGRIDEINSANSGISAAVEEQSAATGEVASNINEVLNASTQTKDVAAELIGVVEGLDKRAQSLKAELSRFLGDAA